MIKGKIITKLALILLLVGVSTIEVKARFACSEASEDLVFAQARIIKKIEGRKVKDKAIGLNNLSDRISLTSLKDESSLVIPVDEVINIVNNDSITLKNVDSSDFLIRKLKARRCGNKAIVKAIYIDKATNEKIKLKARFETLTKLEKAINKFS